MKTSGSKKIAERYVEAAFSVASDSNSVAAVEKDFAALSSLLASSEEFASFLKNPLLTRKQQAQIAENVLKKMGASALTSRLVSLLAAQKRLTILPEIIELFAKKCADSRGEVFAELISAHPVSKAGADKISKSLGEKFGKKVILSVREDVSLLGGAIINIGSKRLDCSLAGKLNRLQQSLKVA